MGTAAAITIFAIFAGGFVAPALHRWLGDRVGLVLSVLPAGAFAVFLGMVPWVAAGEPVRAAWEWVPSLGISLTFFVDGLSLLFLLVISGIGTFVAWYAAGYLHGKKDLGRFYLYLMAFMGAMLGIVASDNLILLFIFWELTSITSYLLIGYYAENEASRRAALQALIVTGGGGLAMLAGIILLGVGAGTFEVSALLALPRGSVQGLENFPVILALILLGAFTKSAQFPFHFWLPNAMEAPAPVSSFLHSATMVKAGVFLLARLHPALAGNELWFWAVAPVGAATMMTGVFLGLGQRDLKRILAYTTLAVLGTLTMLLGMGTQAAIHACIAYLLAHALYKAALFMAAGSVDHETGTRDCDAAGGLWRAMPFTAAAALMGALSMAGVPVFIGFLGKEYFYKALLYAGGPLHAWVVLGVTASVAMVALAAVAGIRPFVGKPKPTPKPAHEAPWTMWLGPALLGVAALKFGLFPGWVGAQIIGPAASAVAGDPGFAPKFALPHAVDTALVLSVLTLVLGAGAFFASRWFRDASWLYAAARAAGPERGYDSFLAGLTGSAAWQTRVLQNGYLRNYILVIGGFASVLIAWLLVKHGITVDFGRMTRPTVVGVGTCAMMVAGTLVACFTRSRMTAILALGAVGLGVAVLFLLYSAPDLAMTQVLVETLTVVLFVLAFYRLPPLMEVSSRSTRVRDAAVATVFGALTTGLVLVAFHFSATGFERISTFMEAEAYPSAFGKNVVNVILVDFRALDTLGEIMVLAIAALGVFAMLKLRPPKKSGEDAK